MEKCADESDDDKGPPPVSNKPDEQVQSQESDQVPRIITDPRKLGEELYMLKMTVNTIYWNSKRQSSSLDEIESLKRIIESQERRILSLENDVASLTMRENSWLAHSPTYSLAATPVASPTTSATRPPSYFSAPTPAASPTTSAYSSNRTTPSYTPPSTPPASPTINSTPTTAVAPNDANHRQPRNHTPLLQASEILPDGQTRSRHAPRRWSPS